MYNHSNNYNRSTGNDALNEEATANEKICSSVGAAHLKLTTDYSSVAKLEKNKVSIKNCKPELQLVSNKINSQIVAEYSEIFNKNPFVKKKYKPEQINSMLLYIKQTIDEAQNQFDIVEIYFEKEQKSKTVIIHLSATFSLALIAHLDNSIRDKQNNDEESKNNRIFSLANAIYYLMTKSEPCHQGVRNDIIGTLNKVHPGICIIENFHGYISELRDKLLGKELEKLKDNTQTKLLILKEWILYDGNNPGKCKYFLEFLSEMATKIAKLIKNEVEKHSINPKKVDVEKSIDDIIKNLIYSNIPDNFKQDEKALKFLLSLKPQNYKENRTHQRLAAILQQMFKHCRTIEDLRNNKLLFCYELNNQCIVHLILNLQNRYKQGNDIIDNHMKLKLRSKILQAVLKIDTAHESIDKEMIKQGLSFEAMLCFFEIEEKLSQHVNSLCITIKPKRTEEIIKQLDQLYQDILDKKEIKEISEKIKLIKQTIDNAYDTAEKKLLNAIANFFIKNQVFYTEQRDKQRKNLLKLIFANRDKILIDNKKLQELFPEDKTNIALTSTEINLMFLTALMSISNKTKETTKIYNKKFFDKLEKTIQFVEFELPIYNGSDGKSLKETSYTKNLILILKLIIFAYRNNIELKLTSKFFSKMPLLNFPSFPAHKIIHSNLKVHKIDKCILKFYLSLCEDAQISKITDEQINSMIMHHDCDATKAKYILLLAEHKMLDNELLLQIFNLSQNHTRKLHETSINLINSKLMDRDTIKFLHRIQDNDMQAFYKMILRLSSLQIKYNEVLINLKDHTGFITHFEKITLWLKHYDLLNAKTAMLISMNAEYIENLYCIYSAIIKKIKLTLSITAYFHENLQNSAKILEIIKHISSDPKPFLANANIFNQLVSCWPIEKKHIKNYKKLAKMSIFNEKLLNFLSKHEKYAEEIIGCLSSLQRDFCKKLDDHFINAYMNAAEIFLNLSKETMEKENLIHEDPIFSILYSISRCETDSIKKFTELAKICLESKIDKFPQIKLLLDNIFQRNNNLKMANYSKALLLLHQTKTLNDETFKLICNYQDQTYSSENSAIDIDIAIMLISNYNAMAALIKTFDKDFKTLSWQDLFLLKLADYLTEEKSEKKLVSTELQTICNKYLLSLQKLIEILLKNNFFSQDSIDMKCCYFMLNFLLHFHQNLPEDSFTTNKRGSLKVNPGRSIESIIENEEICKKPIYPTIIYNSLFKHDLKKLHEEYQKQSVEKNRKENSLSSENIGEILLFLNNACKDNKKFTMSNLIQSVSFFTGEWGEKNIEAGKLNIFTKFSILCSALNHETIEKFFPGTAAETEHQKLVFDLDNPLCEKGSIYFELSQLKK